MAEPNVDRMSMSTCVAFGANQGPESTSQPSPNRCGKLPKQSAFDEFRASCQRFQQQGRKLRLGLRGRLELRAIDFQNDRRAMGNGLFLVGRNESSEGTHSERAI